MLVEMPVSSRSLTPEEVKMAMHSENDPFDEFLERIEQRTKGSAGHGAGCVFIMDIAHSAEQHLERFPVVARRYHRALELNEATAAAYEKETMLALLYEALDTVYLVLQILDLNSLNLESSLDGTGLTGEDASFVSGLSQVLEHTCEQILELEQQHHLQLDFGTPVDEREGVTYSLHAHWQDFVPGSVSDSFYSYFAQARQRVMRRLNTVPKFWPRQTVREALAKSRRPALAQMVKRLEQASFPRRTLAAMIEKQFMAPVQRHWGIGGLRAKDAYKQSSH
jgi:hypothetical protein